MSKHPIVIDVAEHPALTRKGGIVHLPGSGVILVRGKKKVRAFSDRCPHKPHSKHRVGPQAKQESKCLRCTGHDWTWTRKGRPKGKAKQSLFRLDTHWEENLLVVEPRQAVDSVVEPR